MSSELVTGISSGHLEWKTLAELFQRSRDEFGFDLIEIWSEQIGYPPDRKVCAELRKLSKQHNIMLGYHAPLHGDHDLAHRDATRAGIILRDILRACGRIGVSYLVIHLGSNPDRKRGLRSAMSALAQNRVLIEKQNIRIAIEVVPTIWGDQVGDVVSDFETIFSAIDKPWLGVCLDYGHVWLNGNVSEFIEKLGHKLMYTHVHDNDGKTDDHLGYGMGTIDWTSVLRETFKTGFHGPFVVEYPELHGTDKIERFLQDLAAFYHEAHR